MMNLEEKFSKQPEFEKKIGWPNQQQTYNSDQSIKEYSLSNSKSPTCNNQTTKFKSNAAEREARAKTESRDETCRTSPNTVSSQREKNEATHNELQSSDVESVKFAESNRKSDESILDASLNSVNEAIESIYDPCPAVR